MLNQEQERSGINSGDLALFEAAACGDLSAREQIILGHLSLAKRYAREYSGRGVPTEDLYQEGCYGLMIALDRFDLSRGTPFACFATQYVLKYIKQAVTVQNSNYPGKYNERLIYELKQYCSVYDELSEKNKLPPTDEEMATSLGRSVRHIRNIKLAAFQFLSVSQDIDDPGLEIAASVSSGSGTRPIEDAVTMNILDLEHLGAKLTKREEDVICRRLGFTQTGVPQTWSEISASTGLSIPWLRKTYDVALEKLKRNLESQL